MIPAGILRGIAGGLVRGAGAGVKNLAKGKYGRTATGALYGGTYGAVSNDTSVAGGALMGAGAARYGGAAINRGLYGAARGGARGAVRSGIRGTSRRMRADYRGASMMANRAYNGIKSSLKR